MGSVLSVYKKGALFTSQKHGVFISSKEAYGVPERPENETQ